MVGRNGDALHIYHLLLEDILLFTVVHTEGELSAIIRQKNWVQNLSCETIRGRITFIKSTLLNLLPIYSMPVFTMPIFVAKRPEKILERVSVEWNDRGEKDTPCGLANNLYVFIFRRIGDWKIECI